MTGTENITLDNYGDYTFSINCSGATASVDVTVSDEDSEGSCVNPHNAKIKQSYIGDYELPMPQNQFGEDHLKAIGLKDYGLIGYIKTMKVVETVGLMIAHKKNTLS